MAVKEEARVGTATRTTGWVIVQYLSAAGIRHIFGYPGDPNVELIETARLEGLDLVLARREGTAGFMAEAYGMLTGRPGVCMSTLGPGSTSLVNAVANAYLDRSPMLAISGQITSKLEPYFTHQIVDHNRLFAPITKWAVRMEPAAAASIMRKALRVAVAERPGPVHITTNSNVLTAAAPDHEVALPPLEPVATWSQVFRRDGAGGEPEQMLARARRPVALVGMSALRGRAGAALVCLAERAGCPVVVAPMAKGVFPEDHPYYAGALDMACNKVVWDFLARADLILAVGFDAVELIKPWSLKVRTIHIDSTPNTDQIYPAEVEIVGGISAILEALAGGYAGEPKWPEAEIRAYQERLRSAYHVGRVAGKLNPADVVDAAQAAFPADTIVTVDVGSHKLLVAQAWRTVQPHSFLTTNGLSSMGFAVPAAITAKLLDPGRPVLCLVGDGGFAMVQGELQLAAERRLGIVVVVFCDDSLNRIEIKQRVRSYPSVMTRIERTDLVKLAEAMGCEGAWAESVAELERALARGAEPLDHPLVIEARIDPSQYLAQF
ncbi:MAG: thiamine pyrophosphate-binding protein [Gemmatimonadetes bacterium]|nr:thiamine pyrophosphate-binding protein [Gemmatimonadota bacterium]